MCVNKSNYSREKIKVTLHQYETTVSDSIVNLNYISNYEGKIEGKYDFEQFVYNKKENTKEKALKIKNTGKENIYLYRNHHLYNTGIICIKPNSYFNLNLEEGKNEFYMCHDFLSNSHLEEIEYSFEYELLDLYYGQGLEKKEIPSITYITAKQKRHYYTYLEKGQYSFLDKNGNNNKLSVYIYDENGKSLDANIFENGYRLDEFSMHFVIHEDGIYYVVIENNDSENKELLFSKYNYKIGPFVMPGKNACIQCCNLQRKRKARKGKVFMLFLIFLLFFPILIPARLNTPPTII